MKKDYVPCDIKTLNDFIEEYKKTKNLNFEEEKELFFKLLHNNFCRYIYNKGKYKGMLCLNRFKDINELKYCHTHRWELKPYIPCNFSGCNEKTKTNICRKCKKILNTPLPDVTNEEMKKTNIPNALYRIKDYYLHSYYKKHIVNINLIIPKYVNNLKIKRIKNNEYCKYFCYKNKKDFFKSLKNDINEYNIYINDKIKKFSSFVKILIKLKKLRKKYLSIDAICKLPLPPVSIDEEVLLNLNVNYLYEKKDSNAKVLELDISKNKSYENKKKFSNLELYNNNKCIRCNTYKNFIKEIMNIIVNFFNKLIDVYADVMQHNQIKMLEIFNILKKPKLKPININKIYNDFPKITSYGDKFTYMLKEDMKELDKICCDIYNNIDKVISDDIINNNSILKIYK